MSKKIFLLLLLCFSIESSASTHWQHLAPGIEYLNVEGPLLTPWSHIYAFRIDPNKHIFSLIHAKDLQRQHASVETFAHYSQALIAINGGFFDTDYHPLGLRIRDHHQTNPLKPISWWGIFYIKNNTPYISHLHHFHNSHQIDFAVQSGPRLLINGRIPSLKPGISERTALGITNKGKIIILVTNHMPMTTTQLARLMKSSPFDCRNALNLDGGASSQIYTNIGSLRLNVHGFSNVSDAVIVKK